MLVQPLTDSLFAIHFWDSWMQAPLIFRASWFRGPSLMWQPYKLGSYMYGLSPSFLREKFSIGGFLLNEWHCAGLGFMVKMGLNLSYLFWLGYFFSLLIFKTHLSKFWISLGDNCSMCSCVFGSLMRGGKFKSLLCHHLDLEWRKLSLIDCLLLLVS